MPDSDLSQSKPPLDSGAIREVLGDASAQLIDLAARRAQHQNLSLFLVGGVVRDLLLNRRNLDLDFVLESEAIRFVEELAAEYGGHARSHKPFGTATWRLDAAAVGRLSLPSDDTPLHLDFARARSEAYAYPTALPTVKPSSIENDLWRRDFSLNALALQLSPKPAAGRLLDLCGGLDDLERKLIRVLHDHSFVDDPTRILRALRFAARYQFELEPRTAQLLQDAMPLLGRLTGKRLCNELELILREDNPADVLQRLQALGALRRIHPAMRVSCEFERRMKWLMEAAPRWAEDAIDNSVMRWNLLLADSGDRNARAICKRFDLPQALTRSITDCARLVVDLDTLGDSGARPSEIARRLDGLSEDSLYAAWITLSQNPEARRLIEEYATTWRHLRPSVTGNDLKHLGLPPGPRFKLLLDALRSAWIDGDIRTKEEEAALLRELLAKHN